MNIFSVIPKYLSFNNALLIEEIDSSTKISCQNERDVIKLSWFSTNDDFYTNESNFSDEFESNNIEKITKDDHVFENGLLELIRNTNFKRIQRENGISFKRPFYIIENTQPPSKISKSQLWQPPILMNESFSDQNQSSSSSYFVNVILNDDNDMNAQKKSSILITNQLYQKYNLHKKEFRFHRLSKRISANRTNNFHLMTFDFVANLNYILNPDSVILSHQSCKNTFISQKKERFVELLEQGLAEDEMLIIQQYYSYRPSRRSLVNEIYTQSKNCLLCSLHKIHDMKMIEISDRYLFNETLSLWKIVDDNSHSSCLLIIDEMINIFMMLRKHNSFKILFSMKFNKLHENLGKMLLMDNVRNYGNLHKMNLKYEKIHFLIHILMQNHLKMKLKLFPELKSFFYLLYCKKILEKLKFNNTFFVFYYSLVSLNLFFDILSESHEINFLIENMEKENNRFNLQIIVFLVRVYYIQPIVACLDIQNDIILKYSYLIKKIFLKQIEYTNDDEKALEFHHYLQRAISCILGLNFSISPNFFLKIFKDEQIDCTQDEFCWFDKGSLAHFRSFLNNFAEKNQLNEPSSIDLNHE